MAESYLILTGLTILFGFCDWFVSDAKLRPAMVWQWPLHFALYVTNNIIFLLIPFSMWQASQWGQATGISLVRLSAMSWALPIWLIALSFVSYWDHFFQHKIRVLWAFHRIHHSDEVLDASTSFRHHPIESAVGLVAYSILACLLAPSLPAMATAYLVVFSIGLFHHSKIELPDRLSYYLEFFIVTPRLHRLHHSPYAPQTDSNFGSSFTMWDRLFKTFRREIPIGVGLDHPSLAGKNSRDFDTLMFEPFRFLWRGKGKD